MRKIIVILLLILLLPVFTTAEEINNDTFSGEWYFCYQVNRKESQAAILENGEIHISLDNEEMTISSEGTYIDNLDRTWIYTKTEVEKNIILYGKTEKLEMIILLLPDLNNEYKAYQLHAMLGLLHNGQMIYYNSEYSSNQRYSEIKMAMQDLNSGATQSKLKSGYPTKEKCDNIMNWLRMQ